MGMPVVVIRGILESGKSTFLIDSIENNMFGDLGKTLIFSQEEGEVEYQKDFLEKFNVEVKGFENKEDWTDDAITETIREVKPHVVFIEANEMWDFNELYMPSYFDIEQVIALVDGTTFNVYLNNMRQRMVDMIKSSDLVIINRCEPIPETSQMKRNVRMINNSCAVMAVDLYGNELKLESDLPFSLKEEFINLKLEDFGMWYVDTFDSRDRYEGRIVEFDCMACFSKKLPPHSFVAGRMAMTCCANDIQLIGHLCAIPKDLEIQNKTWIHLRARIHYMAMKGTEEVRTVLEYLSHNKIDEPSEDKQLVNLV